MKSRAVIGTWCFAIAAALLLPNPIVLANPLGPQGIAIQGTIVTPEGALLEASNVSFVLQVRSPGVEDCLLYEESHNLNMTNSGGVFSLTLGTGIRSGTDFQDTSALKDIFNNALDFTGPLTCTTGSSYTPLSGQGRQLIVTFDEGRGPQTLTHTLSMQSVPYSLFADSLNGKSSQDFIQVNTSTAALSQGNLESVFNTPTSVTDLLSLIAGSSSKYVSNSTDSGARLPTYTSISPPVAPQAGDIWYNATTQSLQYFNGVSSQSLNAGNSVTSITAGTGLSGGTITSTGTISLPNVGVADTYTKVTTDAQGRVTGGGSLYLSDLKSTQGGDLFTSPSCTSSETLTWNSLTDKFVCQSISVSAGGASTQVQFNSAGSLGGDSQLIWDNAQKRLGINSVTPAAKLDVGGDIKVGDSAVACASANRGSIRYNNSLSVLEFCNGTSWNLVQAAACSDATPNSFTFNNVADHPVSTLTTSNIVQVTGFNCTVPVTISGGGSPEFQICADSACVTPIQGWTSSPSSIVSGQYLQVRQTSHDTGGDTHQVTLIAGTTASVWTVSTAGGDCVTTTPPVGTVCADGTVYAGITPDGNVKMFTTRCDIGQTWNGSVCTGSNLVQSYNNGAGGHPSVGGTSNVTGQANTTYLVGLVGGGAPYNAATVCHNLTENGHSDWYLPARHELEVLYANRNEIKNFKLTGNTRYWSSTERNALEFISGDWGCCGINAYESHNVRCVRKE